ncbi:MarR family winged helix-turn-helix transcriptional regulator [Rhodoplanes sp. Z2-YC6860]|uniref:MarR family winged helix-turn-helix transcriptional regulator n=1 Tax=Rhodoplanes sp. Z2-YC6860 TaxID=674703 RepID=UPI00078B7BB6|nr:MarR family transcriptional regulator [Rhodoplanes sp. Z2-YC6860]AMN41032.1 MarR family transcriptional regulator [Rhodoplanes sp. Z2-YC6860]
MNRSKTQDSIVAAVRVPEPGEGKRGEAGYLSYLLRQAAGAVRLRLERKLADLGVTPPQFLVLTMLDSYPGASGADVARLAMLTPQTVHGIISNLERAELISRSPHPVHGRVQVIVLTKAGRTLLARCKERALKADAELKAGLSPGDEAVIRRWLIGLAKQAD